MKPELAKHPSQDLPVHLAPGCSSLRAVEARAAQLTVTCPLTGADVIVQRCAFCERSEGLDLNAIDGSLTLRCRLHGRKG